VFEQIAVHVEIASTGGQKHWSFGIIEPVVLIRLEAEHRRQVVAEVDPVISEGVLGEENFDAFVTISVPDLNDKFVIRKSFAIAAATEDLCISPIIECMV